MDGDCHMTKRFTLTADELRTVEPMRAPIILRGGRGERGLPGRDGASVTGPAGAPGKDAPVVDVEAIRVELKRQIVESFEQLPRARDGAPGLRGEKGEKGEAGLTQVVMHNIGRDGVDGKDADIGAIIETVLARMSAPQPEQVIVPGESITGPPGGNGWTSVLSLEDGEPQKEYLRVIDWVGGDGDKPPIGYVTRHGIVDDVRLAINLHGARGRKGDPGLDGGGGGPKGDKGDKGDDGTGTGSASTTIEAVADGTVHGHRAVIGTGADKVALADSSDAAEAGSVIGISLTAAFDGETTTVQVIGEIDEPTFNFVPGPVYFDAIGALTQVVPTSGYIQQVAVALDATKIAVQIGPPIVIN
jgi:hypothetical protein